MEALWERLKQTKELGNNSQSKNDNKDLKVIAKLAQNSMLLLEET